jgi:hypothetical protein
VNLFPLDLWRQRVAELVEAMTAKRAAPSANMTLATAFRRASNPLSEKI